MCVYVCVSVKRTLHAWQPAEPLAQDVAVLGPFVVGREARGVRRLGDLALEDLVEGVDPLARGVDVAHQMHLGVVVVFFLEGEGVVGACFRLFFFVGGVLFFCLSADGGFFLRAGGVLVYACVWWWCVQGNDGWPCYFSVALCRRRGRLFVVWILRIKRNFFFGPSSLWVSSQCRAACRVDFFLRLVYTSTVACRCRLICLASRLTGQ